MTAQGNSTLTEERLEIDSLAQGGWWVGGLLLKNGVTALGKTFFYDMSAETSARMRDFPAFAQPATLRCI